MTEDNFVDASRPSAGRMYDYFLGGNHNFEVDRLAAQKVLQLLPFSVNFLRLQRWALQDLAVELTCNRGYDVIIDFASGLPTNDHFHYKVAPGTRVIYSDYDPVIVEYGKDILKDTPNTYIFQADARHPEELLGRPEIEQILAGRRKVAFVFWGISTFLTDDELVHAAHVLYDWAAPGSCWALNAQGADLNPSPARAQVAKIYEQMGSKPHARSLEQYQTLIQPWRMDKTGFISLLEWHGFDKSDFAGKGMEDFGPLGGGYGAYLIK
jgi:hypothetical protein